jgi:hypothetical protein
MFYHKKALVPVDETRPDAAQTKCVDMFRIQHRRL